jgi:hypothetical protein
MSRASSDSRASNDDRSKDIVGQVVRIYGSRASGVFVIYVHCGILCVRNCQ